MKQDKNITIACLAADLIPDHLGGAETHVVEVIKHLSRHHHLLLFVGPDTSIQKTFNHHVTVYPVNYPKIPNLYGLSYILFGFFQASKVLQTKKFDLLWAKQCFPQAPLAALLKKKFNKPLYVTAQNPMLHYEELVIKGKLLRPLSKILPGFITPLIRWSLKQADLVASVSRYSANLAKKMGAQKVIIIPNGIDLSRFQKLKKNKNQSFTIISVSQLIPRNGLDILIEACSLLPKSLNWRLLIVGEGIEKEKLESLSSRLKIQAKIKFLGPVANKNIPHLLSQANVFVRPSRWEGFGVAFLEAMAASIPVIATPVGGIPDFVQNNKTGLLVQPENPQQVKKAIIKLYQNKKLYQQLVKNSQAMLREKYQWSIIAQQAEKAMLRLCLN